MLKSLLVLAAAAGLFLAGALVALLATPEKLTLMEGAGTAAAREAPPPPPVDRTDEVLAEVAQLRSALQAFAQALDEGAAERAALRQAVTEAAARQGRAATDAQAALLTRLDRVDAALDALFRKAAEAPPPPPPAPPVTKEAAPEPAATPEPAPEPVKKRKSLAELLASRQVVDIRDRLATWDLVPGSCRVGFDGTSTLHNFTARSDAVAGQFALHLNDLASGPSGALRVPVATLDSDNKARDEDMHALLSEGGHPDIACEILSCTTATAREDGGFDAQARVRFTIHGQSHELDVPLRLDFSRQRLLHVKGEAKLLMSDFGVKVPSKLGVIKVEDAVTIWWDLYAQAGHGAN